MDFRQYWPVCILKYNCIWTPASHFFCLSSKNVEVVQVKTSQALTFFFNCTNITTFLKSKLKALSIISSKTQLLQWMNYADFLKTAGWQLHHLKKDPVSIISGFVRSSTDAFCTSCKGCMLFWMILEYNPLYKSTWDRTRVDVFFCV